jgi:hypothetical protein
VKTTERKRPSNATYVAKAIVFADGAIEYTPANAEVRNDRVEVNWYEDGRIKVIVRGMAPAAIRQAYLTGQDDDVIIDLIPDQLTVLEELREQVGAFEAQLQA